MKKRIIVTAAITACLALCAAVWPQAETVGETPAPPQTPAVSAPEPIAAEVCILSSENPWYCHKNSLVVANRIPWSLPNKIPGSATLLHPHEGVSQAVAWTIKSNQVAMVGQTVNHGSRHLVIGKNGAPFGKLQIGGNDQAAPFVAA